MSYTVISKVVEVTTKEKAKKKVLLFHFIRIATEDDCEEAREVKSGEYSNQPVAKKKCRIKGKSNKKFAIEDDFEEAREL